MLTGATVTGKRSQLSPSKVTKQSKLVKMYLPIILANLSFVAILVSNFIEISI